MHVIQLPLYSNYDRSNVIDKLHILSDFMLILFSKYICEFVIKSHWAPCGLSLLRGKSSWESGAGRKNYEVFFKKILKKPTQDINLAFYWSWSEGSDLCLPPCCAQGTGNVPKRRAFFAILLHYDFMTLLRTARRSNLLCYLLWTSKSRL